MLPIRTPTDRDATRRRPGFTPEWSERPALAIARQKQPADRVARRAAAMTERQGLKILAPRPRFRSRVLSRRTAGVW